jgi:glycosyltransferase involved in cell wall biosynthesis
MCVPAPPELSNADIMNLFYRDETWLTLKELQALGVHVGVGSGSELLWSGHAYDYSGYAKANRELMFRVSKQLKVRLSQDGLWQEPFLVEPDVVRKLHVLKENVVSVDAPLLRFYTPRPETTDRFRICFTMMETERTHPDFISRLNTNYDEVWVPTHWNKRVFEDSGLRIPCRTVPLGVDVAIYKQGEPSKLPECELVTTARAGVREVPQGFLFISVFQPTFRKGLQHLLPAFEEAFAHDADTALVLGATAHSPQQYPIFYEAIRKYTKRSRIYALTGKFSEHAMAANYRACQAFVSMSLGEGWNLPMVEAAACGLPVIVPRNTAHLDLVDNTCAFVIDPEGYAAYPGAEDICQWYEDAPFSMFGKKSHAQLVTTLLEVRQHYTACLSRGLKFTDKVITRYNWDASAMTFMSRFSEFTAEVRNQVRLRGSNDPVKK